MCSIRRVISSLPREDLPPKQPLTLCYWLLLNRLGMHRAEHFSLVSMSPETQPPPLYQV